MRNFTFLYIYSIVYFTFGCKANQGIDSSYLRNPFATEPVFSKVDLIKVPQYRYVDNDSVYTIKGDGAEILDPTTTDPQQIDINQFLKTVSTVSRRPTIAWAKTGNLLVSVAIFNKRIQVEDNQIKNTQDIVWQWHSKMSNSTEGSILYENGRPVVDGKIIYESKPDPLIKNYLYSWAVWAWDDKGVKVIASSREQGLYVK